MTLGRLCRQPVLLAGLTLLCVFLPFLLGVSAENAFSGGVSFSGLTLAVTAAEGDDLPEQIADILSGMEDIRQYCTVEAMDYAEAAEALKAGRVTGVLVLPEGFVSGILNGSNPDVTLLVPEDRPLEALLTLWVGRSASDLLAAAQAGIYAVLDQYRENPGEDLAYQDVMMQINLRYINFSLSREDMFRVEQISATGGLPLGKHYALSLLLFLVPAMSAFFMPAFEEDWLRAQRRLRAVGWGWITGCAAALAAVFAVTFVLIALALLGLNRENWGYTLLCAFLWAGFCAGFAGLCCLVSDRTGTAGLLSFGLSLGMLGLSGGILPPVMMPPILRKWIDWSPVSWMRTLAAQPEGIREFPAALAALVAGTMLLLALDALLYCRRALGEVRGT